LHEVLPFQRPNTPYLLVQRVFYDKHKEKSMVLIKLNNPSGEIKIGRNTDCDIREHDVSLSRLHAKISLKEDGFYVQDNNSRYGTLVLMRENVKIGMQKVSL